MTDFDTKKYEEQVLKQLRKHMPHLPRDFESRYAVQPGMGDDALHKRVEAVVRLWNKHALRPGPIGYVAQQLVQEHNEFLKAGQDPATAAFWVAWNAQHSREVGGAIDELAKELSAAYGTLGVITKGMLQAAAATRADLGAAELEQAKAKARLTLVEPVDLPTSARLRGQFKTFHDTMLSCRAISLPQLLFPELETFGILDRFTVSPAPANRKVALTADAVRERMEQLEQLPDSPQIRAMRAALGFVRSEGEAGTDLRELALFHLLQEVRRLHADQAPPNTLHRVLVRDRLQPAEAGRIVVSLMAQGTVRRNPADTVAELLAEGLLTAAQKAAAALPDAEGAEVRAQVERQRLWVEQLRARAEKLLAAGQEEQARGCLREAMALASDQAGLPEQLAGIPTTPALSAHAGPDGGGVRITWQPAPTHGSATTFQVVRGNERAPDAPDDGTAIAVENGHATDLDPPVGRPLQYAVFAREATARWSRPVYASTQVVPPVTDLVIEGGPEVVHGHWRVHKDVVAVEVRRTARAPGGAGEPIAVEGNRSFRDTAVVDGTPYFYVVTAVYPSVSGGPALRSTPVNGRGATRLEAKPIEMLSATPVSGRGPTVQLNWKQQPGNEVVIRRAAKPCPWEYGAHVAAADLACYGTPLDDSGLTARGTLMTLVAAVPPGRSWLVAFTVEPGGGAVRGQDTVVDLVEPVRDTQAQRFGDDILITWEWPEGASAADVSWSGEHRRITLQQFRDEGGCHLRSVPAVRQVNITAILPGSDGEGRAPQVSVEVAQRLPKIGYWLRRRGHRLAGGVRCIVTLTSAEAVRSATLVLVGSPGGVMPLTPGSPCVELLRETVSLEPNTPHILAEVTVPGTLRKPYWLRCFLAGPVQAVLIDPPISQLKVS